MFLEREGRSIPSDLSFIHESVWADFLADSLTWDPIEEAPRDGRLLEVLYDDGLSEKGIYWSAERACVGGRRMGSKGAGWVSTEAGHLPTGDGPVITHYRR